MHFRHLPTSRRSALAGIGAAGLALALAGCTKRVTRPAADVIAGDPLGPFYTETIDLIATYDQAIASTPAILGTAGPLREDHRQHAIALAALIGIAAPAISVGPGATPVSGPPSPPGSSHPAGPSQPAGPAGPSRPAGSSQPATPAPGGSGLSDPVTAARSALSTVENTAQLDAVQACLAATGDRLAVLASIAVSRACHVVVLR